MQLQRTAPLLPLLAPVHLLILSVIVLPSLYVVWLSLNTSSFGQAPRFVGLQNYWRVLTDPAFHSALWNTVVLVVVAVHLELAVGLGMALLFASGLPFRRFLLVAVLAPYAVSEVTAVVMWRFLFDPDAGPITLALHALGLPSLDWSFEPSHAMVLIGLLTIWLHLPFTFVIVYAARLAMPAELYEASRIDGATRCQALRQVTPYQDKDAIEDFGDIASGLVQGMTVDGKLIGIPVRHATHGLSYNEALLEEAGISAPPTTLEELIEQAKKTTFTSTKGDIDVGELRRQQLERGVYLRNPDGTRAGPPNRAAA
ncbi:ABC transporter permease subunit [Bosea sp. UC22_33]|uniref:ABC transporter permease subunit n=1 Tax=Bosea sp. UC22_33 TaxID=3350165 RepID=UPI00366AB706